MPGKKGKFIVIDGTDGSGKATQLKILSEHLKDSGLDVEIADFPQYGQRSAAVIEDYLNGKYGTADEVGPYAASIFYAIDRYDASFKIKAWLEAGKIVISNRYVTANMGHQGGKILDKDARLAYFDWLYRLEYEIFGIPKPDLNIILHVDAKIAQRLIDKKGYREYIGGEKKDIHEADLNHLINAEKVYLEIASAFPDFSLIECTKNGSIMSIEAIHEMVWNCASGLIFDGELFKNNNKPGKKPLSVKVELLDSSAKMPTKTISGEAELNLFSSKKCTIRPFERKLVPTGIRIHMPHDHIGYIYVRREMEKDEFYSLAGAVYPDDLDNELKISIFNPGRQLIQIDHGQKIAQLILRKQD